MSDDIEPSTLPEIPEGYEDIQWHRGFGRQIGPLYARHTQDFRRVMAFRVQEHHTNGMRAAHGGMLMTFADMAWGNAVSMLRSSYWVTIKLNCEFLSSAHLGEWVEGEGTIIHEADDVFTIRGEVWVGDRTILTGSGIFKALQARAPRKGERAFAGST